MSKITQALEKAARERLQREQRQPTAVPATPVTVQLVSPVVSEIPLTGQIEVDPHIVCATDTKSPIAEQYRILKTNLQSLRHRANFKTIVVTSAVHGEGKSVTSVNLALTLARQEQLKVALVDADMRRSSVHRWLGLPDHERGLSTVLRDNGVLNGSLVRLQSPALTVLPGGPMPNHPAELLESVSMRRLLDILRAQFDLIIIDSPPVLAVADPSILAAQADGVLLVVRAGRTQLRTVTEAKARLEQVKAMILGCVLTQVSLYSPGYYRYYRAHYQEEKQEKREKAKAQHDAGQVPVAAH